MDGRSASSRAVSRSRSAARAVEAAWAMAMFLLVLHLGGWRWGQDLPATDPLYRGATGLTLASVIFAQIGNLVGRRYETRTGLDAGILRNPLFMVGIALELVVAVAVLYWPRSRPHSGPDRAVARGTGSTGGAGALPGRIAGGSSARGA